MLQIDVSAIRKELLIEREEVLRMIRDRERENEKRAWYYTYKGALEFAHSIGGITTEQFLQEEKDFEKAVEACWAM